MGVYFDFDDVDAFTAGAMGVPGQRTFFIQVRRMGERVTLKCEKQHTAALADFLRQVITQQPPPIDRPLGVAMELADVSDVAFDLGGISLGYDRDLGRVIVQFDEIVPVDEEGEELPDFDAGKVRVAITVGQAVAFIEVAEAAVAAGRPSCLFCGRPIDPNGHMCPRMN